MKKTMAAVIAAAGVLMMMTGCGNRSGRNEDGSITLSIGYTTAANEDDPYHITAAKFKELVEERSGGSVIVNEYPSSQLGSEPEMWEGMQTETCDMAVMTNAYVSSYVHANGCLDLPFIFRDLEQARAVLDGEFGQALIQNMERRYLPGFFRGRLPAALHQSRGDPGTTGS